jgi:hypothetical protein
MTGIVLDTGASGTEETKVSVLMKLPLNREVREAKGLLGSGFYSSCKEKPLCSVSQGT